MPTPFISSTAAYLRANDPDGLNLDAELGDRAPIDPDAQCKEHGCAQWRRDDAQHEDDFVD